MNMTENRAGARLKAEIKKNTIFQDLKDTVVNKERVPDQSKTSLHDQLKTTKRQEDAEEKVTSHDGGKKEKSYHRSNEIKIVEEVDIESSHQSLHDMIEEGARTETSTRQSQQNNAEKDSHGTLSSSPKDIAKENITNTGPKIKLIHVKDTQDNPSEMQSTLKPMSKYVRMRRIGSASYPKGNLQKVKHPIFTKTNV